MISEAQIVRQTHVARASCKIRPYGSDVVGEFVGGGLVPSSGRRGRLYWPPVTLIACPVI